MFRVWTRNLSTVKWIPKIRSVSAGILSYCVSCIVKLKLEFIFHNCSIFQISPRKQGLLYTETILTHMSCEKVGNLCTLRGCPSSDLTFSKENEADVRQTLNYKIYRLVLFRCVECGYMCCHVTTYACA